MIQPHTKMPYISRIYKDSNNLDEYFTGAIQLACIEETEKGHIPVNVHLGKRSVKFYVSRDICIDTIQTFLHESVFHRPVSFEKILVIALDKDLQQYQIPLQNISSSQTFEQQVGKTEISLSFLHLTQDQESHPQE